VNGNGWRDPADAINRGTFQPIEELPGRGRESFDVTSLAFSVERVECQRTLPGSAQTANRSDSAMRNLQREVLQIIDSNTFKLNSLAH
jgi:hypothetical protein